MKQFEWQLCLGLCRVRVDKRRRAINKRKLHPYPHDATEIVSTMHSVIMNIETTSIQTVHNFYFVVLTSVGAILLVAFFSSRLCKCPIRLGTEPEFGKISVVTRYHLSITFRHYILRNAIILYYGGMYQQNQEHIPIISLGQNQTPLESAN